MTEPLRKYFRLSYSLYFTKGNAFPENEASHKELSKGVKMLSQRYNPLRNEEWCDWGVEKSRMASS